MQFCFEIPECSFPSSSIIFMSVWKSNEKLLIFASLISPSKIILFEKQYQAFDRAFHHSMKHLKVHQKYSAARRIFNSLLSVSSGDETLPLMLDILHERLPQIPNLGKEVLIPHSLLILPIPSVSYENLACRTSVIVIQNIVSFCNPRRFDPYPHSGESHILSNPCQYPVNLAFREFRVVFGQIQDPGTKHPSRTPFPSNYSNSSSRLKLAP